MSTRGRILITGGAGFVGSNLAQSYLSDGHAVTVLDNFSRAGVEQNWEWLRSQHSSKVRLIKADIEDEAAVSAAVKNVDFVFHFAAQVAVTTSLRDPLSDFGTNVRGTLNVLEAVRRAPRAPGILYTSTNKVYGSLSEVPMQKCDSRYEPANEDLRSAGIDETKPLEFHSPYGCSKGAADQYVLDYARCYGLRSIVFRMSCICGTHQYGNVDQGWITHVIKTILDGEALTVYGDGRQVRDVLFIDDLVRALRLAEQHSHDLSGAVFNIGGGPKRTTSVIELIDAVQRLTRLRASLEYDTVRTGDQLWYVSDIRRFSAATGWHPEASISRSIQQIATWLQEETTRQIIPSKEPVACVSPL